MAGAVTTSYSASEQSTSASNILSDNSQKSEHKLPDYKYSVSDSSESEEEYPVEEEHQEVVIVTLPTPEPTISSFLPAEETTSTADQADIGSSSTQQAVYTPTPPNVRLHLLVSFCKYLFNFYVCS